jgi:alpha-maltose-1-phosphate synthase
MSHMRVIHLLRKLDPAEWSGTEVAIHRLFQGLREHSVCPVAYCPRLPGGVREDPLTGAGFEVCRFRAFLPVVGMAEARRRQLVSVGGNLMSLDLLSALRRDQEFAVMHTHTLGRLGGIGLTMAKRRQVPFVVTIHGGVMDLPDRLKQSFNAPPDAGWDWGRVFGLLFRAHRLFKDADAILTCNEREAELLRQTLPDKNIVVQPHGVPTALYREDSRAAAWAAYPQTRDRQVLLCLGRIDPVKNQAWLVEQAPAIFQRHPRAFLVFAGPTTDEPYYQALRKRTAELGLNNRSHFTGLLPPGDPRLIGLLQSATALILPSLSETFGLVILEAWAAGTVVLSARASGPAALVREGQNGWLFDLENPASFHQALDFLLTYPEKGHQMAKAGAKLTEQFSIHALAGRLKALYEKLIETKHAVRNHS